MFLGINRRTPTSNEIENCSRFNMKLNREWNPHINRLSENEAKVKATYNYNFKFNHIRHSYSINSSNPVDVIESNLITISSIYSYNPIVTSANVTRK